MSLGIKARLYLKNSYSKKARSVTQEVELLPSKVEGLSSNPVMKKNKRTRKF
jgi:hypothetical protein